MKNMRFKVGDRVRIKTLDWYYENKDEDGIVELSTHIFTPGMSQFCGKVMTIEDVFEDMDDNGVYYMEEIDYDWTDEMIEGLVEEKTKPQYEDEIELIGYSSPKQFICPIGYEFKDENGNVINTTKIVLEKEKEVSYPKTYVKCLTELIRDNPEYAYDEKYLSLETFKELLICRDAYWKIAGEEMGLGKPWEPDWENKEEEKYTIEYFAGMVFKDHSSSCSRPFAFPTPEMRDAFYECFKTEIEICKELL